MKGAARNTRQTECLLFGCLALLTVSASYAEEVPLCTPGESSAEFGETATLAGGNGAGFQDGPVHSSQFFNPYGVSVSADGSWVFVADTYNNCIRKIDMVSKTVSILTGSTSGSGFVNSVDPTSVQFASPNDVAISVDQRWLYVADTSNHCIRYVNVQTGATNTLAGTCMSHGYDNGAASVAQFQNPLSVAASPNGLYLLVTDRFNERLRLVTTSDGTTSTVRDLGVWEQLDDLRMVAFSPAGDYAYVTGYAGRVYRIKLSSNTLETLYPSNSIPVFSPWGITISHDHQFAIISILDGNRIYRMNLTDLVTETLSGDSGGGTSLKDGDGLVSRFDTPLGLDLMPGGQWAVVAEMRNHAVRMVSIADGCSNCLDHPRATSLQSDPGLQLSCRAECQEGWLWLNSTVNETCTLDASNCSGAESEFTEYGTVSTLTGSIAGFLDGQSDEALFDSPSDMAFTADGMRIVVADKGNHRVRLVSLLNRTVTTLAGGTQGFADGPAMTAMFDQPAAVDISTDQQWVFVSDQGNHRIRKISLADGMVSTVCGSVAGLTDGSGTNARFNSPRGLAVAPDGTYLLVVDGMNGAIRKVTLADSEVSTRVTGLDTSSNHIAFHPNGLEAFLVWGWRPTRFSTLHNTLTQLTSAGWMSYRRIQGIAVTPDGLEVIFADTEDSQIQRTASLSSFSPVFAVSGSEIDGFQDGDGLRSKFNQPDGVAVSPDGLWAAVADNNRVRMASLRTACAPSATHPSPSSSGDQPLPSPDPTAPPPGSTTMCPAGQYARPGSNCSDCSPGTFSEGNATVCDACAAGKFADSYGSSQCDVCAPGYASDGGATQCVSVSSDGSYDLPANGFGVAMTDEDTGLKLFLGMSHFVPTGSRVLSSSFRQVSIALSRTSVFTVASYGQTEYSFVDFFSVTVHRILDADRHTFGTNASVLATVSVVLDSGLQPNPETGLIPLSSVRVATTNGGLLSPWSEVCVEYDESAASDLNRRLQQSCAPAVTLCEQQMAVNAADQFGTITFPVDEDVVNAEGLLVELALSTVDGAGKTAMTSLSATIKVQEELVQAWCDIRSAKEDLRARVDARLLVGSSMTNLSEVQTVELSLQQSVDALDAASQFLNARSIQSALLTFILDSRTFFAQSTSSGWRLEIEDMLTLHVNGEAVWEQVSLELDSAGAIFVNASESGAASLQLGAGLATLCPDLQSSFLNACARRWEVRNTVASATALDLEDGVVAAAEFMDNLFEGRGNGFTTDLGTAYRSVIDAEYDINNNGVRAMWINPAYQWTGPGAGRSNTFTLSQRVVFVALVALKGFEGSSRRHILVSSASSDQESVDVPVAIVKYDVEPREQLASILGSEKALLTSWTLVVAASLANVLPCAATEKELIESLQAPVEAMFRRASGPLHAVLIVSARLRAGDDCRRHGANLDTRESHTQSEQHGIEMEVVVASEPSVARTTAPFIDHEALAMHPDVLLVSPTPETLATSTVFIGPAEDAPLRPRDTADGPIENAARDPTDSSSGNRSLLVTVAVSAGAFALLATAFAFYRHNLKRGQRQPLEEEELTVSVHFKDSDAVGGEMWAKETQAACMEASIQSSQVESALHVYSSSSSPSLSAGAEAEVFELEAVQS